MNITLPIHYASLPLDAQLAITVWDVEKGSKAVPIGGSTMRLFRSKGTLKRGQQRCYLHPQRQADPNDPSETPSDVHQDDEFGRLLELVKDFERGDMTKLDWLDALAFREIERIQAQEAERTDKLFLNIDLPRFDFPVVFAEQEAPLPQPPAPLPNPLLAAGPSPLPPNFLASDAQLWRIYDPESIRIREDIDGEGNPVEAKYRRLARSHRTGRGDRELKPGPETRDLLYVSRLLSSTHVALTHHPGLVPATTDVYPFARGQGSDLAISLFDSRLQAVAHQIPQISHMV